MPITLTARASHDVDYASGVIRDIPKSIFVRKPIRVPIKAKRDFEYDLTYIANNKNFVGGGFFTKGEFAVIVDKADLRGFEVDNNVIITDQRGKQFQVEEFEYDDFDVMVYIHAKGVLTS